MVGGLELKLYMAVTPDEYELPLDFGTSKELGKKFNISPTTIRSTASRKYNCKDGKYRFVLVELDDDEE